VRRIDGGEPVVLTRGLDGTHRYPSWSPDGEWIAFTTWDSVGSALHVTRALGGDLRVVVRHESSLLDALVGTAWSPDGEWLAFKRGREVSKVSLETGEVVSLADVWAPHSFAWSPDGETLAVVSGNSEYALGNAAPSSIILVPSSGGLARTVVSDEGLYTNRSPVWLPGGSGILFISNRTGIGDIYRLNLSPEGRVVGDAVRRTTGMNPGAISLSADGAYLAYSTRIVVRNIYRVAIPAPDVGPSQITSGEPLTEGNQAIETLAVSPDGAWIAFDSDRSGFHKLFKLPTSGGDILQLSRGPGHDFAPSWSSDGDRIAFYSFRGGNRDIWVIGSDGRELERVTSDDGSSAFPDWVPDGRAVAFQHNPRGGPADAPGIAIARRGEAPGAWSAPEFVVTPVAEGVAWAPDGQTFAFTRDGGVWLSSVETGESWPVPGGSDLGGHLVWSPDGKRLYSGRAPSEDQSGGIWSIEPVTGVTRQVVADPNGISDRGVFDTDGRVFYYTVLERSESDLWILEVGNSR
jgi:Tol biopolymer transport system component